MHVLSIIVIFLFSTIYIPFIRFAHSMERNLSRVNEILYSDNMSESPTWRLIKELVVVQIIFIVFVILAYIFKL